MKIKSSSLLFTVLPFFIWTIFTYPLIFNLKTSLYTEYFGDWVGSITRYRSIYAGERGLFLFEAASPYSFLFKILAYLGIHPVVVYNLAILFGFLLTFFGGFFFARSLKVSAFSSFLFASVVTIAPIRLWYSFEWLNHPQWGFILFYLAALFKFLGKCERRKAILAGLLFGLVLAENYSHGVMLFFFTVILLGVDFFYFKRWQGMQDRARSLGVFALSSVLFSLPSFYLFLVPGAKGGVSDFSVASRAVRGIEAVFTFTARPWHYIIPDINHPIFGNVALGVHRWFWNQPPYYLTERFFPKEHTLYLGIMLLALSCFAFYHYVLRRQGSDRKRFLVIAFAILALCMFLFSLPPYISFFGLKVYFPSYFVFQILPQLRAYARFGLLVFISNAVLAVLGLDAVLFKVGKVNWRRFVKFMVIVLVLFEFINFPPFHNISVEAPEAYHWLAEQEGDFAYLEYPTRIYYTDKLYQHIHGKEILNPYHQTPDEVLELMDNIDSPGFEEEFKSLGGRYIFFHNPEQKTEKQRVAESWGFPAWGTHADIDFGEEPKELEFFLNDPRFRKGRDFGDVVVFEVQ